MCERILRRGWRLTVHSIRYILKHLSRTLIIRLKGDHHTLRQYEARQLEPVLEECTPHYEERAQLRLPPPDAVAQSQVVAPRRTEFKENPIGERSHVVEFSIDRIAKGRNALDRRADVS